MSEPVLHRRVYLEEQLVANRERIAELEARLASIQEVVDRQAEDQGLWFKAETAPEAYLQQALRNLHRAIEVTR